MSTTNITVIANPEKENLEPKIKKIRSKIKTKGGRGGGKTNSALNLWPNQMSHKIPFATLRIVLFNKTNQPF